jgi:hypothetical protein
VPSGLPPEATMVKSPVEANAGLVSMPPDEIREEKSIAKMSFKDEGKDFALCISKVYQCLFAARILFINYRI